ncbi:MAG: peptidoglycan DD-metalloendopeptidase family protein [Longimicrobiales bacterium]
MNGRTAALITAAAALLAAGCEQIEEQLGFEPERTPHESYTRSLQAAGLITTALGSAWIEASRKALETTVRIEPPYSESGFLASDAASALGIRVDVREGEEITVNATLDGDPAALIFIDLFHASADTLSSPRRVASADSGGKTLRYEVRAPGDYIVRVQPELLRGGRYTVTIETRPALAFPLPGLDSRAIGSYFGAPRDGGARNHHGVDIFAPRGTPVVAVAPGIVSSVRETARGGRVVWLRDEQRGLRVYYAHLDRQLVASGQRVETGDTLGLVGNTGNAANTPPHLHLGIYRRGRGPLNPYGWLHERRAELAPLTADSSLFGRWARLRRTGAALRAGAHENAPILETLPVAAAARVIGGSRDRLRVQLPDGREGFLAGWLLEAADAPLEHETLGRHTIVRAAPGARSTAVGELTQGTSVGILARFAGSLLVRAGGQIGWITPPDGRAAAAAP